MNKRTNVAEITTEGEYIWHLPKGIIVVGAKRKRDVEIWMDGAHVGILNKQLASDLFETWFYPPGSIVLDESNEAKLRRQQSRLERYEEPNTDIPRQDLEPK